MEQELHAQNSSSSSVSAIDALLEELASSSSSQAMTFSDVDATEWYAPFVEAVSLRGIIRGDADADGKLLGTFRPGDSVTVAEMLAITNRAYTAATGAMEEPCPEPRNPKAYGHWASTDMGCAEALQSRLLLSYPSPDRPVSRGETMSLLSDMFFRERPSNAPSVFADAQGNFWEADISAAFMRGIVSGDTKDGKPTGTFRPDATLTRGEAAKIIYNALWVMEQGGA